MQQFAVQTAGYIDSKNPLPGYQRLKECGFDAVDFNLDLLIGMRSPQETDPLMGDEQAISAALQPHIDAMKQTGIFVYQAHAPFPTYFHDEPEKNGVVMPVMKKAMLACRMIGCDKLVIHPMCGIRFTEGKEEAKRRNLAFYKELIPIAREYGVTILLENMFEGLNSVYLESECSDFHDAAEWIDELNEAAGEERFGFCLDTGHAFLLKKDIRAAMQVLGHRIKAFHVHDNDSNGDFHLPPMWFPRPWYPEPINNWDGFAKGLRDIDYQGVLSFETYHMASVVPEPAVEHILRYTREIGLHLTRKD